MVLNYTVNYISFLLIYRLFALIYYWICRQISSLGKRWSIARKMFNRLCNARHRRL